MAVDLELALRMPAAERVARHAELERIVRRGSAQAWASAFLSALEEHPILARPTRAPSVPPE
jgi:trehalose-6-phosphate synthase